jgi:hypothetical protein
MIEGPEAFDRFQRAMKALLTVPKLGSRWRDPNATLAVARKGIGISLVAPHFAPQLIEKSEKPNSCRRRRVAAITTNANSRAPHNFVATRRH